MAECVAVPRGLLSSCGESPSEGRQGEEGTGRIPANPAS